MQSKTSFFNKALYKKTLLRFWPFWGFATFIAALFPFSTVIGGKASFEHVPRELFSLSEMLNLASTAVPILTFIYAAICAGAVWNYLYSSRSVGMFHSLPITRSGLFVTNILAGMSMMLIPYLCAFVLEIFAELFIGTFSIQGLLTVLGVAVGECILFFGFATLMAFLTGSLIALPALYIFFNFIFAYFRLIVITFANGFIYGIRGGDISDVDWLSPLIYLLEKVGSKVTYEDGVMTECVFENGYIVIIYAFIGLAMMAIASLLYRFRRSEVAGDYMASKPFYTVMCTLITAAFTTGMGSLLYEIYNFNGVSFYKPVPMLVCLLISCVIGYYLTRMVLSRSLRVFGKKSGIGLAIAVTLVFVFVGILHFDVFKVENNIPAAQDVSAVTINAGFTSGNNLVLKSGVNDYEISRVIALHKAALEGKEHYYELMEKDTEYYYNWLYVDIRYQLKDGKKLERHYRIPVCEDFKTENTYAPLYDLANMKKAVMIRCGILENGRFYYGEVQRYDGPFESFSKKQGREVIDALIRDIEAGNIGEYDFLDEFDEEHYIINVTLETVDDELDEDVFSMFLLTPKMKHTVDKLLEINAISAGDLILEKEYFNQKDYSYNIEEKILY